MAKINLRRILILILNVAELFGVVGRIAKRLSSDAFNPFRA